MPMARPTPLSGFPERLPQDRIVEEHIVNTVRRVFELHGYAGIETRAVEPLEQLAAKGETSKEVYLLRRLHADESDRADDRTLGLHRSEEHTSELQSRGHLVCRLLLQQNDRERAPAHHQIR